MRGFVLHLYSDTDPLNIMGKRNVHNADRREYNCAGYALGTFSWYQPRGVNIAITADDRTAFSVQDMLEDFPSLRVIHELSELKEDEQAIAFRVQGDGLFRADFHFMLRAKNGHWFHKMGNEPKIRTMTQKRVFSPTWFGIYNGPLVLFARKMLDNKSKM